MTFAAHTKVPVETTRAEIDRLLGRHGATQRGVMQNDETKQAIVAFVIQGAKYRIEVPLADKRGARFSEQVQRTRWRLVLLALKTKLELVALGVSTVEKEFLASLVLTNGKTVQENLGEFIQRGLGENGPRMLGDGR
jgi:hypothetical protein